MTMSAEQLLELIDDTSTRAEKEIKFVEELLMRKDIGPALKMRLLKTKETLLTQDYLLGRAGQIIARRPNGK